MAAVNLASPKQIELLPTGAGQARVITHDALEHTSVAWSPSGHAVVFSAYDATHAPRNYWMDLDSGKTHAITPEGTVGLLLSPDGKFVLVRDSERVWMPSNKGIVCLLPSGLEANRCDQPTWGHPGASAATVP